jgi:hypothetical protein
VAPQWLRRWGKEPSPEQLAHRRERTLKEVRDLVLAAGINSRRDGGGGLLTESVLVFRPAKHYTEVFDQDANVIGFVYRVWQNDWWQKLCEKNGKIVERNLVLVGQNGHIR